MTQMTTTTPITTEADRTIPTVTETLDRLSLEQALIDVEVANARVIDLTDRLTESHAELQELRRQSLEVGTPTPVPPPTSLRALVVGPVKAVARLVLPLSVRTRIRSALG